MFRDAFSGFSVDDIAAARRFYEEALELKVVDAMSGLILAFEGGQRVFMYPKEDHQPATFTVLNLEVDDIDGAVDSLTSKGIEMLRYDDFPAPQDERGILRGKQANMGPDIAWFNDPAGNILAVVSKEEKK